jgi:Domain of unknown function (DUF4111)
MDIRGIRKLTPYRDINDLLADWSEGVKDILGEGVVGLYLSGSLTYNDFVPGRSDIDLQAVVKQQLNETELKRLEKLHKDLYERYSTWRDRHECSYISLNVLKETLPPKTPRPWWGFDTFYTTAPVGNEWIINHYFLSIYGVALYGPSYGTLIPAVNIPDLQKASAKDLFKEWAPKIEDSAWMANSHHQSYLVLNLCRILTTVIVGEPTSKKIAATWTKANYPQWNDLIEEAAQWEYGKKMECSEELIAFIKFSMEKVRETGLVD